MEYNLLDELEDILTCPICYGPAIDSQQEKNCGRLFCRRCIQQWEGNRCPHCWIDAEYFPDKRSSREVQALEVKCNNDVNGCCWVGTIGTLIDHLNICDYACLQCPNGCSYILRKDLQCHLNFNCPERQVQCNDCGLKDRFRVITGPHEYQCEKKMVNCVNEECGSVMERRFLQEHLRLSCGYSEISCKYASVGCSEKKIRREMADHEEDVEHHFPLALNTIAELTRRMERLENQTLWNKRKPQFTFKMTEFNYKKRNNEVYNSEPFYTSPTGYKMKLVVYANGNGKEVSHLSLFLEVLHGPYDDQLDWPLNARFAVELLNQLEDGNHFEMSLAFAGNKDHCRPGGGGWGYEQFIELSRMDLDTSRNTQYLKDDTLYLRVTPQMTAVSKTWLDYTHN